MIKNRPVNVISQTLSVCIRAQELCESRGGRPGLPVPNNPYGLCGRTATLNLNSICLFSGIELATVSSNKPLRAFFSMLLFAIMAPVGVAIGMGVTSADMDVRAQLLTGSILQAIATGAFLYVTSYEILGPELATHDGGVLKVLTCVFGFFVISGVQALDS